jgi:cell surface protein SprA
MLIARWLQAALLLLALTGTAVARTPGAEFFQQKTTDTTRPQGVDTLHYPIQDRRSDGYSANNRHSFDLRDTAYVKRTIEYDPKTKQYYIVERIGGRYYRTPTTMTQEEFLQMQARRDESDYFRRRASTLYSLNNRRARPSFGFSKEWMNRITGAGKVSINPSGYVDIAAGYQGQKINNPTLPERARRNGGFDFQMNAQLQVDAKIGDKINLPINYNTLANFDFENQLKLDYQGKNDEILKLLQAGNVNFASKGTLIPGAQSLFGVKTQLQFGKLYMTGVMANQRSQRQSASMQGSAATMPFNIRADEYEENRHFLLGHFFRLNYNGWLKRLPLVTSNVQISRVEVWVTNRTGATTNTRDIVGLMNLGEVTPFGDPNAPNSNANSSLYSVLNGSAAARNSTTTTSTLVSFGLQPVQDFEKTFARKLQVGQDFNFNQRLGYISLAQPLLPDEVLGVAYEYTYNGKRYQVGEFSQDIPPDSSGNSQKVLFLKLLKATSQRPQLPIWRLMMKNVYTVGYGSLQREDFKLDVVYEQPSLGEKRYLPLNDTVAGITPTVRAPYRGVPLIQLVNLDRLNNQNDPQPNGVFDFIEDVTVVSAQSRIIFPVLEPFGRDLEYVFENGPANAPDTVRRKYIYYPLYDTIKAIAQTYANLNRYKLVGKSKQANNVDYQLGFNIPRGSVTATAGGRVLQEGVDYEINYDLGTLHVINPAIIQSGIPVQIQFENNATFGLQQRNYMAMRLDYLANKHLTVGGTVVRLSERPFFTKQLYGEDPIRNTMYGVDFDYRNDIPRLTRWLNKLPFYSTKAMSGITAYGEAAYLQPGHAPQIGKGNEGQVYIDDFEGTRSSIDLRFPLNSWALASTPQRSRGNAGAILFPEAVLQDDPASNYNRAKLAWYNIEPVLQEKTNSNNPLRTNLPELSKPETRQVFQNEIFPKRTLDVGQGILTTFDMAFYPREKGPYNYRVNDVDANNRLTRPDSTWGGIMRAIDQTDFETGNVEFIEFWMQDPFISGRNPGGGYLYFNLGNISEDVLKDGKRQYENGLPTPSQPNILTDESNLARVPRNPQQVTNAFSNDPADRPFQDVGFDGLPDSAEQRKFGPYVSQISGTLNPGARQAVQNDPSNDNFRHYRDAAFTDQNGILERYKNINNPQGNSPVATNADEFSTAFTMYPDQEELNRDNTLNETEEYFQYQIHLTPNMVSGSQFITDIREVTVRPVDGSTPRNEKWYLFRIPVQQFQTKVGNIPDFKSIRFIRMFMTGFNDTLVARFGKLELVRNQWRRYNYDIDSTGNLRPYSNPSTSSEVLAVNLEENDQRQPIPYRTPPGIDRQQQLSNNNTQLLQNEQSLSLKVCGLNKGDARGVFKTMNMDLRQYGKLSLFIHAESSVGPNGRDIRDGELSALVRIGSDFSSNYYEIKVPLKITDWNARDSEAIWPSVNTLELALDKLTRVKMARNRAAYSPSRFFSQTIDGQTISIIGNPNLGEVRGMMLAVKNTKEAQEPVCAEVWFNELRLSRIDEEGAWAALGRVDIRLADLGAISLAGSIKTKGWGTLEQRVNERSREDFYQYDLAASLDFGKLLPKSTGIQIPVYLGYSKAAATPEYDPYDLDVKLREKLDDSPKDVRDSIKDNAIDQTVIKTVNFSNVKKNKTNGKPTQPWDISNIDLNYSYTHQTHSNPIIESDDIKRTRAAVGYTYAPQPKYITPLKGFVKSRSPWLAFVRDFNFNYKPTVGIKADVFRQFGSLRPRNVGGDGYKLPETYDKKFTFDRYYTLRWQLTQSLLLDFNSTTNAIIDEPYGRIDDAPKKDTVKRNFWSGGRTTHYSQVGTLSYNLPTAKFPFLDWTSARIAYTARYDWIASSLAANEPGINLGNKLLNGQTKDYNAELNFDQLYNKFGFLRNALAQSAGGGGKAAAPPRGGRPGRDSARRANKEPKQLGFLPKALINLATSLKRVGVAYNTDMGTILPGYLDSAQGVGANFRTGAPGWKYIFGYQPDTNDINSLGDQGILTRDRLFNELIQQRYKQTLRITAQLQPIRDLTIDLNWDKSFEKNYSELYKDTGSGKLERFNPAAAGAFSISYISYQTLFTKFDPNEVSETFRKFEAYRQVLSQRLGAENPYQTVNGGGTTPDGYAIGYGRYAQDVVIPAFIAAYTGKDPNSVAVFKSSNPDIKANPFSLLLPKPNWSLSYSGLSRLKPFEKLFTNFTIRHGYQSTLGMNNFNTSLLFSDPLRIGYPRFIDTVSKNYIPYFLVPNVTIDERFTPLIEADMTFTNQLSARFEFKKSRMLSLSLTDYQLAENRSTEYTFGFNWRKRGVPFLQNVRIGKNGKKLDNDVTFRFDFSLRDDATANSKLDQNTAYPAAGQKVIRFSPTIDYVLNNRINVKLYFENNKVIPKLATTAPMSTTRGGVQIRVSLAP